MSKISSDSLSIGPYKVASALHRSSEISRFACNFPAAPHGVRLVAVSVLPASAAARVLDSAQLLERIGAVRNLQHPLIPELFDVALRGDRLYTVEALAEGIPLSELLSAMRSDGRTLDAETGATILSDIAGALIHAQERPTAAGYPGKIFHGGLSTDTVMVTLRGELRLEQFALGPWLANRAGLTPMDGCLEDVRALARIGAAAMLGDEGAVELSSRQMAAEGLPDEIAQTLEAAMLQRPERSAEALASMRASLQLWLRSRPTFSSRHRLRTLLFDHIASRSGSALPPDAVALKRAEFSFVDDASLAVERHAEPDLLSFAILAACDADAFASHAAASNARRVFPMTAPNPTPGAGSPVLPAFGRTRGAGLALSAFDAEMFSGETLAVPMPSDYLPEVARPGNSAPVQQQYPQQQYQQQQQQYPQQQQYQQQQEQYPQQQYQQQQQLPLEQEYQPNRGAATSATGSHLWQGSYSSTGNAPVQPASKDRLSTILVATPTQQVRSRRWMLVGAVSAAALLYGLFSWQKSFRPPPSESQQIQLTSSPLGARVVVGGVETGAVTPTTLVHTSIAEIKTLTVRREGFETPAVGSADITSTAPLSLLFKLKPLPHTIRVESFPPGAAVLVDGAPCGTTPTVCMPIYVDPVDGATLEFRREGFSAAIIPHSWEPGLAQSTVVQTLQPLTKPPTVPGSAEPANADGTATDGAATKASNKSKAALRDRRAKAAKATRKSRTAKTPAAGTATPPAATEKPN